MDKRENERQNVVPFSKLHTIFVIHDTTKLSRYSSYVPWHFGFVCVRPLR